MKTHYWPLCNTIAVALLPILSAGAAHADDLRLDYRADGFDVVSGGDRHGGTAVDLLAVGGDADLDKAFGWRGATASVTIIHSNGTVTGDKTGAIVPLSAIEVGDSATRLYEAWIEAPAGPVAVKAGVFDLNSEFDVSDPRGLFLSAAQPIGPEFAVSGLAGPSIYPRTGPGLRGKITVNDWTVRAGVFDGRPGDPDHPLSFASLELSSDEGALLVAEAKRAPATGLVLAVGAWTYTASFDVLPTSLTSLAERDHGNGGLYASLESSLPSPTGTGQLRGFLRVGASEPKFNLISNYEGAGAVWTGPLASRPHDALGLAFASSRLSRGLRFGIEQSGEAPAERENSIELTYNAPITNAVSVQPTISYINNPGGRADAKDAVAIGLRFHATLIWTSPSAPSAGSEPAPK